MPEELGEAVLGVWVWAIRHATVNRAGHDPLFLDQLNQGTAEMLLGAELAPPGWRDEDLRAQLTRQTGLPDDISQQLLRKVASLLGMIDGQLFEPLGSFSPRRDEQPGFVLHFRDDFLDPVLDGPVDLGEEAAPRPDASKQTLALPWIGHTDYPSGTVR